MLAQAEESKASVESRGNDGGKDGGVGWWKYHHICSYIIWISYGYHMDIIWISYGYHMVTMTMKGIFLTWLYQKNGLILYIYIYHYDSL